MSAPTLYFLEVKERLTYGYDIYETHCGQEKGCVSTEPQHIDFVKTKEEVQAIIDDWKINPPLDGILEGVVWIEVPRLPTINTSDVTDNFCGEYTDYPEIILAMAELSGMKAYRAVADDGSLRFFTFEVER
jgi:hypothetical protein